MGGSHLLVKSHGTGSKGHLVPMSWKYSFKTSKNKMSEANNVLAEGDRKREE